MRTIQYMTTYGRVPYGELNTLEDEMRNLFQTKRKHGTQFDAWGVNI